MIEAEGKNIESFERAAAMKIIGAFREKTSLWGVNAQILKRYLNKIEERILRFNGKRKEWHYVFTPDNELEHEEISLIGDSKKPSIMWRVDRYINENVYLMSQIFIEFREESPLLVIQQSAVPADKVVNYDTTFGDFCRNMLDRVEIDHETIDAEEALRTRIIEPF